MYICYIYIYKYIYIHIYTKQHFSSIVQYIKNHKKKDTHREKAPSNKTPAHTKSMKV